MKAAVLVLMVLMAGAPAHSGDGGIALAIMQNCDDTPSRAKAARAGDPDPGHICVEPFFTPTFDVKVLAGEWPGKGDIQCRGVGTELHCGNGLRLTIERIRFH